MDLSVDLDATSDVLVYFSFNLEGLDSNERAQINPQLDGSADGDFRWLFTGNPKGRAQAATVMASFPNQDPGTHTVEMYGAVSDQFGGVNGGRLTAGIWSCVLTVFVIPTVPA